MSLTWALGLSHWSVSDPLSALECPAFRMSGRAGGSRGWQSGGARHEPQRARDER